MPESGPVQCPLPQLGPGFPGHPTPISPPGPSPGGRWSGRRPNPERPGRLPPPHAAALTRPCRRPGAHPCGLEKLAGSNPEPATPRPAHTIAPPPGGGSRAALPAPRPRRRAAPAPGHPPGSCRLSDPRGCAGGAGRRGGGAERGWAARAPPHHGLASGRRRQLRVPSGLGVGCAGVSSLWPAAGWWRERGTAESAGRGCSALGHGRTRKPGARDWGNCCGAALAFL